MTAPRWARHSLELGREHKVDAAITAGFDPGEDYGGQLVDRNNITPEMARRNHQAARVGCEQCSVRCDRCDERMCATWGPEPRACGTTCVECPCDCTTCVHVRQDMRADLMRKIEKERP